jgi:anti-sigma regulatory factor (Ser/Thr protein kinase)
MARVLLVHPGEALRASLAGRPPLQGHELAVAAGRMDAVRRLRRQCWDVLVTSPATSVEEDLAFLGEVRCVRPSVRPVVLAPRAAPESVLAALRARVFALFTEPFDAAEIAEMAASAAAAAPWHDGIEVVSARPEWLSVRLDASVVTAERLLRYVAELRSEVPDADLERLLVAYREVLLSAIEHGADGSPGGLIEVAAVRTRRALVFYVKDPGPGFDPGRAGGFGLLVGRTVVDEVIQSEHANQVVLIKHTDR